MRKPRNPDSQGSEGSQVGEHVHVPGWRRTPTPQDPPRPRPVHPLTGLFIVSLITSFNKPIV